jgi:hypothetical protein
VTADAGVIPTAPAFPSAGHSQRKLYRAVLLAATFVLCVPILLVRYPPLTDYPNHLARAFVLERYDSTPAFQADYTRSIEPTPNVGSDVALVSLMKVLPPEIAGRVLLLCVILAFVAGCHLLGNAIHGRNTLMAIPCSFLVYNSMFLYGFVNYLFGVALFCITFAMWLRWARAWTGLRILASALLVLAAYFVHLTAFAFMGIACTFVLVWRLARREATWTQAALGMLPLIPPIIAFLLFMTGGGSVGRIVPNSLAGKIAILFTPLISYSYTADGAFALAFVVLGIVAALRTRSHALRPAYYLGLAFLAIALVAPLTLLTASAVDARFVLPGLLLVLLSLQVSAPERTTRRLVWAFLVIAAARTSYLAITWLDLSAITQEQIVLFEQLPEESRIYAIFVRGEGGTAEKRARALTHIAHYATLRRHAHVSTLFAAAGQPLVRRQTAADRMPARTTGRLDERLRDYDYVWSRGLRPKERAELDGSCVPLWNRDGFTLCRLRWAAR